MSVRPLSVLALLSALAGAPALAQDPAVLPGRSLPQVAFDKTTLPNGLDVILVEDHRLPIVAVNLWYHVGSADEAPGQGGFARLFAHMMLTGNRYLPRGLAGSKGSAGYDRTSDYATVPSNQLALALWVRAERMGGLLDRLDQAALSKQLAALRDERRRRVEDRPYGIVEAALNRALFPQAHPYYAPAAGSPAGIQPARLADARDFFKRYYGPDNASIVIAGDIDKAKARALVAKYFGGFKRSPPVARPQAAAAPITRERRLVVRDRIMLPRVYMAWLTPPAYQPGDAALAVAARILAGGRSGRLYKNLVYQRQIAQGAAAAHKPYALASVFEIEATARPGSDLAEIESAIDAELGQLRDAGPSDAEVERAKHSLETAMLASIERLGGKGLANRLNRYNQYLGDPGYLPKDIERLRRVSAADVRHAARTWLRRNGRVVVEGVPGKPDLGTDSPAPPPPEAAAATQAAGIERAEAWRNKPPKAGPAPRFALPQGDSFRLPNGLTVIHYRKPGLPLVAAELVVKSGADANPDDQPGLAGYTADMLEQGTATRSAPQIADEIAQLGAFLDASSTVDASTVTLLSPRPTFAQALDVLADLVQHPAFPTAEVERQRAARLGELVQRRGEPARVADAAARSALYGSRHPYGYGQLGTEQSIRATTRDDLYQFWRRHYVPANAALIVSGDVTTDELRSLALARFGAWPRNDAALTSLDDPAPTRARLVVVDAPGARRTALRVTTVAAARNTPDYPALQVMNAALDGRFPGRPDLGLRAEGGDGVFSRLRYHRAPGPFAIVGSVRAGATGAAVADILRQVRGMRDAPLPAAAFAHARDSALYSLPGQFETNRDIDARLAETYVFGLPSDYWRLLPEGLRRVNAAQVQAVAKKYLDPGQMKVIAVGDPNTILPQLKTQGLGEAELRDSDGQLP